MTNQVASILASDRRWSKFLRFIISGGANTAVTYLIYLMLLHFTTYQISYTIAYVVGIFAAYFINRHFVFRTHRGWQSIVLFPLVYVIQYLVSMCVLRLWVEQLHLSKEFAPLVAIAITVPLTFALSRIIFGKKAQ